MRAKDVMTSPVISVAEDTTVADIVRLLLAHHISAVPVTDRGGRLVGIVSEGDLVRRIELGTERPLSWWHALLSDDAQARAYAKSHGQRAADVMTREVVAVGEEAELAEVAGLLERHRIKRLPVVRDRKAVGIVSRVNLVQALLLQPAPAAARIENSRALRERIEAELKRAGVNSGYVNVTIDGNAVHLWGFVPSLQQIETARIAAQTVAGAMPVVNHLSEPPERVRAVIGGE